MKYLVLMRSEVSIQEYYFSEYSSSVKSDENCRNLSRKIRLQLIKEAVREYLHIADYRNRKWATNQVNPSWNRPYKHLVPAKLTYRKTHLNYRSNTVSVQVHIEKSYLPFIIRINSKSKWRKSKGILGFFLCLAETWFESFRLVLVADKYTFR